MLSPATIVRLVIAQRYGQLLEAFATNGQYLPHTLHAHLLHSPVSMQALALRRVVELSRGSTPAREQLTQMLLASQLEDGSFDADPLATAFALSALVSLIQSRQAVDPQVEQAHDRALEAMAAMQSRDGLFLDEACLQADRQRGSACILHLLARDAQAWIKLGLTRLLGWFDSHQATLDRDCQSFIRMARASLPRSLAA